MSSLENRKLTDDYEVLDVLGRGGFSVVRRGVGKANGSMRHVAIKTLKRLGFIPQGMNRGQAGQKPPTLKQVSISDALLTNEILVMRRIVEDVSPHPNVIHLYDVYEDMYGVHLVLELCSGGELFDRIITHSRYSEVEAAEVVRQIACGLGALHKAKIVHRDLKPENCLFLNSSERSSLKIMDFGLSSVEDFTDPIVALFGSIDYVSPEALSRQQVSAASDMWSLGVILYILLSGCPPFHATSNKDKQQRILAISAQRSTFVGLLPDTKLSPIVRFLSIFVLVPDIEFLPVARVFSIVGLRPEVGLPPVSGLLPVVGLLFGTGHLSVARLLPDARRLPSLDFYQSPNFRQTSTRYKTSACIRFLPDVGLLSGDFTFEEHTWKTITSSAKDLISSLLAVEPHRRPTADDLLKHPWVIGDCAKQELIDAEVVSRLQSFNARRKFRAAAIASVWSSKVFLRTKKLRSLLGYHDLTPDELENLRMHFKRICSNGDNATLEEFEQVLKAINMESLIPLAARVFDIFDNNRDGTVDMREILCGLSSLRNSRGDHALRLCFQMYDADRSGCISREELASMLRALPEDCLPADITEPGKLDDIFDQMDANSDGKVSFEEFKAAMQRDSSLQDVVLSTLRPN
ncbi:Calcium and calcium/calmodulin-dependent serine/threonine-protein kinase [Dendrobium catenatum]|uniref:Calcium and calcium/calmodulin-dependent serine/threonine-protein kinase n=1 Tax=Dendrobium catenatum TaxID=906689 RepID=A0A2I0VW31_9ASPA|nr:Calcium and calcium/calmodulin-dependent serine/threonine-protein kinase [Dendrobium catenatum]